MSTPNVASPAQPSEQTHLLEYWHVILSRRRLVVAIVVAVTALAALRALLMQPVYQGTTQILIEHDAPQVLNFKEVTQLDASRDDYYQTQYKLLQSRALVREVIEEMNLLASPELGGPRTAEEIAAIKKVPDGGSGAMELAIDKFLRSLRVQPIRNSRLVMVSFEFVDPAIAAQIANKLSQRYIQQTLEFRFQTSAEAGQWLGSQIDDQRKKVEAAEIALQGLKEKEGLVNIEERRTLLEQRLKELGTQLTVLKTDRLQKEALFRQMRGVSNPEELPDVMRSSVVSDLRTKLADLERQQAQLLERYLDQHPEVQKVRNQVQQTRREILAQAQQVIRAAENDYKASAAQEASVAGALEAAKAEALDLSRRGVQYDSVKREVEAQKEVLNSLLSRHKETDVASELRSSNIRIVDPASVSRDPIRPRRVRDILLGFILGCGLAVGLAFFLDYLDDTVKTPEDVRRYLGAPLLSVIPEQTPEAIAAPAGTAQVPRPVLLTSFNEGPFPESYRLLRTALNYCWPESQSRVVAVTSTMPGEGKTTTAINLALCLASMDRKVILIDADLRKPQVHATLQVKRVPGLSDILVGKAKPSEVIQMVSGLSVMSAGTSAPSPSDLLTVHQFRGLIEGLRDFYNWIIVDTPPVGAVADTLVLGPVTDGVVVVAGAEMVARRAAAHTIERIAATGTRALGVVLNRAQVERHSYYYQSYYGHYYGGYYGHRRTGSEKKVASIRDGRAARM